MAVVARRVLQQFHLIFDNLLQVVHFLGLQIVHAHEHGDLALDVLLLFLVEGGLHEDGCPVALGLGLWSLVDGDLDGLVLHADDLDGLVVFGDGDLDFALVFFLVPP